MSRYDKCGVLSGTILLCKSKRRGKLDRERKKLLHELYEDEKTRPGLVRYVFGDDKVNIPPEGLKAKKEDKIGRNNSKKIHENDPNLVINEDSKELMKRRIRTMMMLSKITSQKKKIENVIREDDFENKIAGNPKDITEIKIQGKREKNKLLRIREGN